jgi:isocitrate lyase
VPAVPWLRRAAAVEKVSEAVWPGLASRLNLAGCWFAILARRGVYRSTYALEQAIRRYVAQANTAPRPLIWTKTADEMLESFARFSR